MHELPVIQSILDICLKHARMNEVKKIIAIELQVGEMSDLEPEWMQTYFDAFSKGTLAEGGQLRIEKIPVVFRCDACAHSFSVSIRKESEIICPKCKAKKHSMVSGREYYVGNMEVI